MSTPEDRRHAVPLHDCILVTLGLPELGITSSTSPPLAVGSRVRSEGFGTYPNISPLFVKVLSDNNYFIAKINIISRNVISQEIMIMLQSM